MERKAQTLQIPKCPMMIYFVAIAFESRRKVNAVTLSCRRRHPLMSFGGRSVIARSKGVLVEI